MQNISGGVGEAYPGSTGGEIFNYYEVDSNANIASGAYSTARGYHCQALGNYSIASGQNCTAYKENCIAIGQNCNVGFNSFSIGIGQNCNAANNNIAIGKNVSAQYPGGAQNYGGTIAVGRDINGGGVIYGYTNNGGYGTGAVLIGHDLQTRNWQDYSNAGTSAYYFGASPAADSFSPSSLKIGIGNNKTALESDKDGLLRFPHGFCMDSITTTVNAIDTPINTPASTTDKTLATLGSFQKRYQSWYSSIVFTPDVAKSTADLPSGFQAALYQATEAEFTGTYWGVQVRAKFRLSPNSDETILTNPVVCYNTDNGTYSHTRGFILKLEKSSSAVTITMQQGTSIDFENNNNTFNSYVDSTTTFNISYIQLKMTNF